jgi:catechol 2,3-dioxygenase-like lactoylglutathione lyase family enzyme
MEAMIAKLLGSFEQGKMNRRELIQSLAIAATGAHVLSAPAEARAATLPLAGASIPGSTSPAASGAASFRTAGLDHISYSVSDYGRSRDFYADLMGWEVSNDDGERQATLRIGDVGNIIIRNSRQAVSQAREGRPPLTGVINHVSWRIADFDTDAVREDLESRGLNPRRDQGGGDGYDSYHVLDPDGWDLQIAG